MRHRQDLGEVPDRDDPSDNEPSARQLILNIVSDLVEELCHDGRKNDEDMPRERLEATFAADPDLVEACGELFARELKKRMQTKARYKVWIEDCEEKAEELEAPSAQWAAEWYAGQYFDEPGMGASFTVQELNGPTTKFWCESGIDITATKED